MFRNVFIFATATALTTLAAVSGASACKSAGRSASGEELCITTSDGAGQQYYDHRTMRQKQHDREVQAATEIANFFATSWGKPDDSGKGKKQ